MLYTKHIMWAKHKSASGFTIVELLIVIVVIAILAAITIVSYNGIQTRARNNSKIQAASAILRVINSYVTAKGQYPPNIPFCLPVGTADYNSDGVPDCGNVTNPTPQASEVAATNAALAAEKISVSYPADPITVGTTKYVGIQITYSSGLYGVNGVLQPYFLYFFLEGSDQDCGNSASVYVDTTQTDLYKLMPRKNYGYTSAYTNCAYSIRSPANL